MSIQATDAEAAAVAVAPRVTLADIKSAIASSYEFTAKRAIDAISSDSAICAENSPLALLSICILVMSNGFTVIGKSAPASPENFNADLGRKFAYEDAAL